jgi:hypothetical protein
LQSAPHVRLRISTSDNQFILEYIRKLRRTERLAYGRVPWDQAMFEPQEAPSPSKNTPEKGQQENARLALQQAALSPVDLQKAQAFLDAQVDDPRRLLSVKDRQTLKTLDHAVLTGDVGKLQNTLSTISALPRGRYLVGDNARSLLNAFQHDMESVGLFANVIESIDDRRRHSFSLDLTNFRDNTTLRLYTTGEKTEANIAGKPATPNETLHSLDANIAQSVKGPSKQYSPTEQALYDKWHQLRQSAKPEDQKSFVTADGTQITDSGHGTFTATSDIADLLSGTVKKEANGDLTYALEDGRKVTRKPDGTVISADRDIFGAKRTSTLYGSGLRTEEGESGSQYLSLPDGAAINHVVIDGKTKIELVVDSAPTEGTLTVGKDGTKEYFFNDGDQIYTIKPNGEVTSKNRIMERTVTWAPDGSATSMNPYGATIKDRMTQNGDQTSYSSPDGFQFKQVMDWHSEWNHLWPSFKTDRYLILQNETGTRKMDQAGNLEYTDTAGKKHEYKLSDAAYDSYAGKNFVEYKYPDGTAVTLSRQGMMYFSIPKTKDINQHIWLQVANPGGDLEKGSIVPFKFSPIVYFREAPGHLTPNAQPAEDFEVR